MINANDVPPMPDDGAELLDKVHDTLTNTSHSPTGISRSR